MNTKIILKIENLTKRFPGVTALDNINFDLEEGEIHAVCGENGAGKSTLIKTISGIHPFGSYEGKLIVNNNLSLFKMPSDATQEGISVIYQELALVQEMTVAENIFLGKEPTNFGVINWNTVYSQTNALLKKYNLRLNASALVKNLGVGEQQLVEIVKALSHETKILLLDEPTAALTETEVDILLQIIQNLKRSGITCIYISHKLDEVFAISDRITVIRDGKSIKTLKTVETNKNKVISLMVGREITNLFPRKFKYKGDVFFEVKNLSVKKTNSQKLILENISFKLHKGEVLGFGGLMGAGRTELLMHIFGLLGERVNGAIFINGQPYSGTTPKDAIQNGLAIISEDRKRFGLNLDQSIGFNLSLSSIGQFTKSFLINSSEENQQNQHYFDSLAVKANGLETIVGTLSGGNQQKVVIGKGIMTSPSVVFLDEPTRGIDVGSKQEVYELINNLTNEGKSVLLVSSEMPELIGMSDRIIILSEGKIGGTFTKEAATQATLLSAAMKFQNTQIGSEIE